MQPYAGTADQHVLEQEGTVPATRTTERLHDLLNILLILNIWAIVLVLVPPQHEYPVMDDWIYTASARDMFNTGVFVMPDWSQANLIGLVVWGVLWAKLFGFSISVLTYSVIFLAVCGLLAFYGVQRLLDVPPSGALLGTLMLGFNPLYLHLSYTFMTDVSFLAVELMASYSFLRGVKAANNRAGPGWLVLASLFAGWAFFIRQFGVLVPVAFLGYFFLNGLVTRKWPLKRILAVVLAFGSVVGIWYAWVHTIPATWALNSANSRAEGFLFKPWWPRIILVRWLTYLPFVAIFSWTAVRMRRRSWLLVPLVFAAMIAGMYFVQLQPEAAVAQLEPPFTAQVGPLSIPLPQDEYTFGLWGSVVRPVGIDFDEFGYQQQMIWSPEAWRLLWAFSVLLAATTVTKAIDLFFRPWWRRAARTPLPPSLAFYLLGAGIFLITSAYVGDIFLRYALGFMPFAVLFMVSGSARWGRVAWSFAGVTLVLLMIFSVLLKADNVEHNNVRWEAGRWMEDRVGAVRVGWNWDHSGHADSETYHITDVHADGFRTERAFPYTSRLSGFTTRYVLAESRLDMPPLPEPKSGH